MTDLVLLLHVVPLLLQLSHLSLKVFSLDIDLSEPAIGERWELSMRWQGKRRGERGGVLFDRVLQVLLRRIQLVLQQLNFSVQILVRPLVGLALLPEPFRLGELCLRLFELVLQQRDLSGERGDLLVLGQDLLLVLFVLGLGQFGTLQAGVGFGSEGGKFLDGTSGLVGE